MSHYLPHHLKRLQHDINSNLHLSSHNHQSHNSRTNSFDYRSPLPNNEAVRESIQHFTISNNNNNNNNNATLFQPFKPGPRHARRGGGGGRSRDRRWHSSLTLPKRAINYDLAESFMDHSTNPLSSDIYKIELNHSNKQWLYGRFKNYKEKLNKLDGNIIEIVCTRTFSLVLKRKKLPETNQNERNYQQNMSTLTIINPVVQEEKKKQVDRQTNVYANLFGGGRIPRLSSTTQNRKPNSTANSTPSSSSNSISLLGENSTPSSSSTSISLLGENSTDHQS